MIYLKTDEEIELMRECNLLVSKTHAELAKIIEPGISTLKLDAVAETFIRDHKAEPAFLGYNGFPNTLCVSVNDTVVHGIPSDYVLREGDIVSIDCGVYKNGFYGDSAYTFAVGSISNDVKHLLQTTKESLFLAVEAAIAGNRIGDIGYAVQRYCEERNYSVVREMVGHGIGKKLHEKPEVPNYGQKGRGVLLKHGMVIAIEPMINMGRKEIFVEKDGWTIRTKDGKPSAHFEHSVAIKRNGVDVLSDFSFIEEVLKNKSN